MPHFMDVHNLQGATLADIEQAHLKDVDAQGRYGVTYEQFFHNVGTGQVFCLAEGPSAEACDAVHREANGMSAESIIPVDPSLINAFLGGGTVTQLGVSLAASGQPDTGSRAIVFTDIVGSTRLTAELGDAGGMALVDAHDAIMDRALAVHVGRRVKHTGDGMLASFATPEAAVLGCIEAQRAIASYLEGEDALPLAVRIGIHVGEPVSAHGDLFGLAVNTASRICDAAGPGEILISDEVFRMLVDAGVDAEPRGPKEFKGLSAPIEVHALRW